MIFNCTECGEEFKRSPSRQIKKRPFCSRACYEKDWSRRIAGWNKGQWFTSTCPVCGKEFLNGQHGYITERCSKTCSNIANKKQGELNHAWKGGVQLDRGYITVYVPGHKRAHKNQVKEHIIIAEKALGKPLLVGTPVHHVDGNKANNINTNLVICQDHSYHFLLHRRAKLLRQKAA
jgi:endogenous inhibitor of DNA gyrase (YacG/DUF329 family)